MNNEKEKNRKNLAEKILPWTTLILSIMNLIQLIVNFAFLLREVNPDFWKGFIKWFNIVVWSIGGLLLIILVLIVFFDWRNNKDRWKDRKEIKIEFDEEIKKDIDFDDLESKAEEIIEKIRPCLHAEIEGINIYYWHMGLEISAWKPTAEEAKFQLGEDEENSFTNMYISKFEEKNEKEFRIKGSPHIPERVATDIHMNSAQIKMWDIILKSLINDNWEKIILCSTWKDNLFIRKYCLKKDNYLFIYSLEITKNRCILKK